MNGFDLIARIYENAAPENYRRQAALIDQVIKPKKGQIILDLGGGTGTLGNIIAQKTGAKVVVFENSAGMLSVGKQKNFAVEFIIADITRELPVKSNSVDIVLMIHTLHHLKPGHRQGVLPEIKRILKPGGKVLFMEMDSHNFWSAFRVTTEKLMTLGQVWFIKRDQMTEDLEKLGFSVSIKSLDEGYLLVGEIGKSSS